MINKKQKVGVAKNFRLIKGKIYFEIEPIKKKKKNVEKIKRLLDSGDLDISVGYVIKK